MRQTFKETSLCELPNGGVAIMAPDGRMLAYSKGSVMDAKFVWRRKGVTWKTIRDCVS